MKAMILLWMSAWLTGPAWAQALGHYDLISANEAIQGTGYTISVASWERQKLEITVEKRAEMPLEIRVRAADRQVLCAEFADRFVESYRRVLNLSQLESGRYWLEIRVGKDLIRRELRLEAVVQSYHRLTLH